MSTNKLQTSGSCKLKMFDPSQNTNGETKRGSKSVLTGPSLIVWVGGGGTKTEKCKLYGPNMVVSLTSSLYVFTLIIIRGLKLIVFLFNSLD